MNEWINIDFSYFYPSSYLDIFETEIKDYPFPQLWEETLLPMQVEHDIRRFAKLSEMKKD